MTIVDLLAPLLLEFGSGVMMLASARDELKSVFSLDVFEDKKFIFASGLSLAAIVLGAQLDLFHRILNTVDLSFRQWLVCIGIGLVVVLVSEVKKFVVRRRAAAGEEPDVAAAAAASAAA